MKRISEKDMKYIRQIVGDITEADLKYVDIFIGEKLGIFIPSIGFCQYAIKEHHRHPGYSFIFYPFKQNKEEISTYYELEAMSPNEPHEEKIGDTFVRYIAIFIDKTFFEHCYRTYTQNKCEIYHEKGVHVDKSILFYIKEYMMEYENKIVGYEEILKSLTDILTHLIIRGILGEEENKILRSQIGLEEEENCELFLTHLEDKNTKTDIEYVLHYMNQHFNEHLSVVKLASLINQSKSHFTRCFKRETEKTPKEYLITLRLQKAKRLLEEGEYSITEIALNSGFSSAAHFSDCFKKHFGISPRTYKKVFK